MSVWSSSLISIHKETFYKQPSKASKHLAFSRKNNQICVMLLIFCSILYYIYEKLVQKTLLMRLVLVRFHYRSFNMNILPILFWLWHQSYCEYTVNIFTFWWANISKEYILFSQKTHSYGKFSLFHFFMNNCVITLFMWRNSMDYNEKFHNFSHTKHDQMQYISDNMSSGWCIEFFINCKLWRWN